MTLTFTLFITLFYVAKMDRGVSLSNNLSAISIKKAFFSIKLIPLSHIRKICNSETGPIFPVPAPTPLVPHSIKFILL